MRGRQAMSAGPRIATVSLNAAIDQTALVPGFTAGEVNRVERAQSDAGGKGVNVASFLADFGHQVAVTGLLDGRDPRRRGRRVVRPLRQLAWRGLCPYLPRPRRVARGRHRS